MDENSLDPTKLTKYVSKLLIPKRLSPDKYICKNGKKQPFYTITMKQNQHKLHPDIPATTLWTYNGISEPVLIDNERYTAIQVKWYNKLPFVHLLEDYIDHTIMGCEENQPNVRTVVHVHGGEQSASDDGGPLDWFTPGKFAIFNYPNEQQPTMLFFHSHAMGITRLNAYSGLSGGIYMIRDKKIEKKLNLPKGKYEIPLVITDKMLAENGQLIYSTMPSDPTVHPKWSSHFIGNLILVNNLIWPYVKVKQTKYRFRIVNGSDTRTYAISIVNAIDGSPGPTIYQIGTDGGYIKKPVIVSELLLGIGERADIIIDFEKIDEGTEFIFKNTAKVPFPNGKVPDPNTDGQIMKFIVSCKTNKKFCIKTPCNLFHNIDKKQVSVIRQMLLQIAPSSATAKPAALYLNNSDYTLSITETPSLNSTEIWEFVNTTAGMHPMHVHLIQFQLLNRQKFDSNKYLIDWKNANPNIMDGEGIPNPLDVKPYLQGDPIYYNGTNEDGWKDVIRSNGSEVTRIIIKFAPQDEGTKFPFDAKKGTYNWHCHIISHEDNEMMRPFRLL